MYNIYDIWDLFQDQPEYIQIKDLKKEQIFDFDYPFYKDDKIEFQEKFMIAFKYERIGYNTLDQFKDHLRALLLINYPKYIHYHKTNLKSKDLKWWNNKDYEFEQTRELKSTNTGSAKSTSNNTGGTENTTDSNDRSEGINKFSDTPEGTIDNIDRFMTTASSDTSSVTGHSHDVSEFNSDTTNESSNKTDGTETEKIKTIEGGNIGVTSSGDLVQSWLKDGFIDIDLMMLRDCQELFMQVY